MATLKFGPTPPAPAAKAKTYRCKKCEEIFTAQGNSIACPKCSRPRTEAPVAPKKDGKDLWKRWWATVEKGTGKLGKKKWIGVPAVVAILGVGMLALLSKRTETKSEEGTLLALEEGESRMISVPYSSEAPPVKLSTGDAAVAEPSIFLMQEDTPLLHVLVTAVAQGQTEWSVHFADGQVRRFQVRVRERATATVRGDRNAARAKCEEADRLSRTVAQNAANRYGVVVRYREACDILRGLSCGTADELYTQASTKLKEAKAQWEEELARLQAELTLARMSGNVAGARQILRKLLELAPEERSAEYQKNATLLNYVLAPAKKEKKLEADEDL